MRFREDSARDLARARTAVAQRREQHPQGTAGQLFADLGGQFHRDYAPALRAVLFATDRHRAQVITGIPVAPEVVR